MFESFSTECSLHGNSVGARSINLRDCNADSCNWRSRRMSALGHYQPLIIQPGERLVSAKSGRSGSHLTLGLQSCLTCCIEDDSGGRWILVLSSRSGTIASYRKPMDAKICWNLGSSRRGLSNPSPRVRSAPGSRICTAVSNQASALSVSPHWA